MSNPAIPIPELAGSGALSDPRRRELGVLQSQLEARDSSLRFARAGVAVVICSIVFGAAGKLVWDAKRIPYEGMAVAALGLGIAIFALVQFFQGRKSLKQELTLFERLKSLHRELKLDDPSSLLPKE